MDLDEPLGAVYGGCRIALVGGPLQSKTGIVQVLQRLGAAECLVMGSMGTGALPDAELVEVELRSSDTIAEFRAWEQLAASPTPAIDEALARFAPDLVLSSGIESFTSFAGRDVFGARLPSWTALEDKTTVDALWDDAGVARPPSEVVPVDLGGALEAHERLQSEGGTVWSGDARDGWHGGGHLVHRIRTEDDAALAIEHLQPHCDRLRVAPFLEGLPCSVHGFVTTSGVAALRPVEMVVLRTARGFRYGACATTWDPAPDDREAMREAARRAGSLLRHRVAFRGCFTIDGVMTSDGFRPTELNPRLGAGMAYVAVALPEMSMTLLHLAVIAGAVDVDAAALERSILEAADATRLRASHVLLDRPQDEVERLTDGDVTMVLGPSSMGAFLRITTATTPADGEPYAPVAARALALADERWDLGLGPLEPAPVVR